MMTYAQAKDARDHLDHQHKQACEKLAAIPGVGSGPMGLTPDTVKFSPAYRATKAEMDRLFAALRRVNAFIAKHRRPAAADRKARRHPQPAERKNP